MNRSIVLPQYLPISGDELKPPSLATSHTCTMHQQQQQQQQQVVQLGNLTKGRIAAASG